MPKYLSDDGIEKLFTYRKWSDEEVKLYGSLRLEAKQLAKHINDVVPEGPHKTRAINALHECVMLFNTAATLNPLQEGV